MAWIRLLVILLGLPLVAGLVAWGGWPLTAGLGIVSLLGYREFSQAVRRSHLWVVREVGYAVGLGFLIAAQLFPAEDLPEALVGVLFFGMAASWIAQGERSGEGSAISRVGVTLLGCLYVGFNLSFWVLLRSLPGPLRQIGGYPLEYGAQLLGLTIAATWGWEVVNAFLLARISPLEASPVEKAFRWKAEAVGLVVAWGIMLWGGAWCGIPLGHRWALGGLVGVAATLGQRAKRQLLREAGASQFEGLFAGQASVLAHFSGLLWTVPVAYFYAMIWL
jgi:phosphatidate cytidylyltransferase